MAGTSNSRRVTHGEFFRICEWLRNNQEVLQSDCPGWIETSARIKRDLNLDVGKETVKEAMAEVGINWIAKPVPKVGMAMVHSRISSVEARCDALEETMIELLTRLGDKDLIRKSNANVNNKTGINTGAHM